MMQLLLALCFEIRLRRKIETINIASIEEKIGGFGFHFGSLCAWFCSSDIFLEVINVEVCSECLRFIIVFNVQSVFSCMLHFHVCVKFC